MLSSEELVGETAETTIFLRKQGGKTGEELKAVVNYTNPLHRLKTYDLSLHPCGYRLLGLMIKYFSTSDGQKTVFFIHIVSFFTL